MRGRYCGCWARHRRLGEPDKKGYSREDVERIGETARKYAATAAGKHIGLAIEHAKEPLFGDGETYYGLADIFTELEATGGVPANFGITFDPANGVFTALCKTPTTQEKVLEFLATHNQYIALVHYKTTVGGKVTPVITDADIENEALFGQLAKVYDGIVCLEIPGAAGLAECHKNIDESLNYIRKMGLMGYFA